MNQNFSGRSRNSHEDFSFGRSSDFRTDVSSETLPTRLTLGMMEAGAKINRLELTRELCALESFVLSPQSVPERETKPRERKVREARSAEPTRVSRRETSPAPKGNWEDKYAARRQEVVEEFCAPKEEVYRQESPRRETDVLREFTQTCVRTPGVEVQDLKKVTPGEYLSAISYPAPEMPAAAPAPVPAPAPQESPVPVLACEMVKPPKSLPKWVWTLLYFGSCGTACGSMILGQTVFGIPSSPAVLNFGTAVLVAGCTMFLAAGGVSLNEKLRTA